MKIRTATQADLPRVNELRRQVNDLHVAGKPDVFRPGFGEALQQHLHTVFAQDDHEVLVAETEEGVVGFALLRFIDHPGSPYRLPARFLAVEEFGVDEGFRRQGIGRALFAAIRGVARERDVKRIELNMWEFNEDALNFYESIGFSTYRRYMEFTID